MRDAVRASAAGPTAPDERHAWDAGARLAADLVDRHDASDPFDLAGAAGVSVTDDEWEGMADLVLLGTYDDATITLYRSQIEDYARAHDVAVDALRDAVVAHELGHHAVEDAAVRLRPSRSSGSVLGRIRTVLFGRRPPKRLREAAANGFALALLEAHRPDAAILDSPEVLTALGSRDPE